MVRFVRRFAILALMAGTCALAQDGPVSPKDIQGWVDKDLVGVTANGAPVLMRLASDGKASLSAGNTRDTGTWRLSDAGYCTTWANIRAGQERCFTVVRAGTVFKVANPDGSPSGQFTQIK
jgi:hypothetical protein